MIALLFILGLLLVCVGGFMIATQHLPALTGKGGDMKAALMFGVAPTGVGLLFMILGLTLGGKKKKKSKKSKFGEMGDEVEGFGQAGGLEEMLGLEGFGEDEVEGFGEDDIENFGESDSDKED
jgi:hypothetical protein